MAAAGRIKLILARVQSIEKKRESANTVNAECTVRGGEAAEPVVH
jgi:hypothetical protein